MFLFRSSFYLYFKANSLSRNIYNGDYIKVAKLLVSQGTNAVAIAPQRDLVHTNTVLSKMVDPKRVISYEDMLKVIHQPEKVIIDVRNPEEVNSTGKIPSSINIPLNTVDSALSSMSEDEFKKQYQRPKPSESDELIFYCQSGRRSSEALDRALKLGYSKSKTYLGSWNDWSSRQR